MKTFLLKIIWWWLSRMGWMMIILSLLRHRKWKSILILQRRCSHHHRKQFKQYFPLLLYVLLTFQLPNLVYKLFQRCKLYRKGLVKLASKRELNKWLWKNLTLLLHSCSNQHLLLLKRMVVLIIIITIKAQAYRRVIKHGLNNYLRVWVQCKVN